MFILTRVRRLAYSATLLTLVFFQNCSSPPANNSLTSASSSADTTPFAYSATLDTIGYMSCTNLGAGWNPRAYFTLRAGAYNSGSGGLAMTSSFLSATQYMPAATRAQALANSAFDSGAYLALSLRNQSNFQSRYSSTSGAAQGYDQDVLLPQLDTAIVSGPLSAQGSTTSMLNYFPGNSDHRLMESSLRFFDSEAAQIDMRTKFNQQQMYMVAGYTSVADPMDQQLRSPLDYSALLGSGNSGGSTGQSAYGVGYSIFFINPSVQTLTNPRVLSQIQETDLQTRLKRTATWNCSNLLQFKIVRPQDATAVGCATSVDSASSTQVSQLTAIRRVLRVEDWYVDLNHRCVVPKARDYCYGDAVDNPASGTIAPTIQYTTASCTDGGSTLCPHYVSVCIRQ